MGKGRAKTGGQRDDLKGLLGAIDVLASGLIRSRLPPQKNRQVVDPRVCRLNAATGSNDTGKWRPTPPKFKPAGGVQWATMKVRPHLLYEGL